MYSSSSSTSHMLLSPMIKFESCNLRLPMAIGSVCFTLDLAAEATDPSELNFPL